MTRIMLLYIFFLAFIACEDQAEKGLSAAFDFEPLSGDSSNYVRFWDRSEGSYILSEWNFGNGTSLRNEITPVVFFPLKGDYKVSLAIYNLDGSDSISRTLSLDSDGISIAFTATVTDTNANYVRITNQSGNLDAFRWEFRNQVLHNVNDTIIYFPFNGQYKLSFYGTLNGYTLGKEKDIIITRDDPFYVNSFKEVWRDDFNGSSVNTSFWSFETGAGGWGNQELQEYTNGLNYSIENGILKIIAKKVNDNKTTGSYTSTRINTRAKKEFTYGRIEVRAKLPSGTGIWPAIWTLGSNIGSAGWPACGEIDIMEYVGFDPDRVHTAIHTPSSYGATINKADIQLESCEETFHNYGIIWTERYIRFYIDSPQNIVYSYAPNIKTSSNWPFSLPQFIILNVAVGGTWGGQQGIDNSIFPQQMEIDYVSVYQPQ